MRVLICLALLMALAGRCNAATPVVTQYTGNPVLSPSGVSGSNDEWSVTDPWVGKGANGTYYMVYSGVKPNYSYYSMLLASAPSINGPWTRLGTILDYSMLASDLKGATQSDIVTGGVHGSSDPYCLYDGSMWHLWASAIPTEASTNWRTVGERVISHYTNSAGPDAVPLTGWVLENSRALVGLTTGYTSDGAGHAAGVSAPKVYPKDGGGWVMFFTNWGYRVPDSMGGKASGYATSSSLNGPWVISSSPIIGTAAAGSQYQAEQLTYFKMGSKHYMLCNRSSLTTQALTVAGSYNISSDLWVSDNQLGPYTIAQLDAIQHNSQAWFSDAGVVSVVNPDRLHAPDLATQTVEGIYSAQPNATFKIGALTIDTTSKKILCLGDSITYGQNGSGGRLASPYPSVLQGSISGSTVTNAGVAGETTAQMKTRYDGGLKTSGYSHMVLLGGINDIGQDVPIATIKANLEYLWTDAQSRGMSVVAVTITPWKDETYGYWNTTRQTTTESLNAWIRSRAAQLGVQVVDAYPLFGGEGGNPAMLQTAYDSGDHIHLSQTGANTLAAAVYPCVAVTVATAAVSRATMSASFR